MMNEHHAILMVLQGLGHLLEKPKLVEDASYIANMRCTDLSSAFEYCLVNDYVTKAELDSILVY